MDLNNKIFYQPEIAKFFNRAVSTNKLSHSYIFWGETGTGKFNTALEIARTLKTLKNDDYLNKGYSPITHPDIKIVLPVKKDIANSPEDYEKLVQSLDNNPYVIPRTDGALNIHLDTIRELISWISTSSTYPGGRIAIIINADKMRIEAANAFLKTLEEPKENAFIIMTTSEPESLLPTIRSRTQHIHFPPISAENMTNLLINQYKLDTQKATETAIVSSGSILNAHNIITDGLSNINKSVNDLFSAMFSQKVVNMLQWSSQQPPDRQFMEMLLIRLQAVVHDSMITFATVKDKKAGTIEEKLAYNIKGFSRYRITLELIEDLQREIKLNPQYDIFWSNLPFAICKSLGIV